MKIQPLLVLGIILLSAVLMRVLPHPANVAPVGAMALFGGSYLPKRYAFTLPILVMFLADVFLGFHQSMPYVYASFVVTTFLGVWIGRKRTFGRIFGASVLSSVIFFLVTNFGYWLTFSLYPKTLEGQLQAYVAALPFFRNTLLGDLFYTGIFFGGYVLFERVMKGGRLANLHKDRG